MSFHFWICTFNNPEEYLNDIDQSYSQFLEGYLMNGVATYIIGQLEKGEETGTRHLQFAMRTKKCRLSYLTKYEPKVHYQGVIFNKGIFEYCSKTHTRIEGPWEFGDKPKTGPKKITVKDVLDISNE